MKAFQETNASAKVEKWRKPHCGSRGSSGNN
jgi:hypothetical protein